MRLTKPWNVSIYNDPWNPQRITDECAIPAGTEIKRLARVVGAGRGTWTAVAKLTEEPKGWYHVYAWGKPAVEYLGGSPFREAYHGVCEASVQIQYLIQQLQSAEIMKDPAELKAAARNLYKAAKNLSRLRQAASHLATSDEDLVLVEREDCSETCKEFAAKYL